MVAPTCPPPERGLGRESSYVARKCSQFISRRERSHRARCSGAAYTGALTLDYSVLKEVIRQLKTRAGGRHGHHGALATRSTLRARTRRARWWCSQPPQATTTPARSRRSTPPRWPVFGVRAFTILVGRAEGPIWGRHLRQPSLARDGDSGEPRSRRLPDDWRRGHRATDRDELKAACRRCSTRSSAPSHGGRRLQHKENTTRSCSSARCPCRASLPHFSGCSRDRSLALPLGSRRRSTGPLPFGLALAAAWRWARPRS